jgi:glycine/D-amino acid oxidase-like deaminating enzyme
MAGQLPGYSNVYVNCGHGTLGWTECCATADLIADMICGTLVNRALATGLSPSRFVLTSQYYAFAHGSDRS